MLLLKLSALSIAKKKSQSDIILPLLCWVWLGLSNQNGPRILGVRFLCLLSVKNMHVIACLELEVVSRERHTLLFPHHCLK